MPVQYHVFISHAGEDKDPLAFLIYEILKQRGIRVFLDQAELQVGGNALRDMDEAMETAMIGLFILSPEFALKPYPMKELVCFLRRIGAFGESSKGMRGMRPVLIPVFYRLTVAQSKYAEEFMKTWCHCNLKIVERFKEREAKGETSVERVLECLRLLAVNTGIENVDGVTNDETDEMARGRRALADRTCDAVSRILFDERKLGEKSIDTVEEGCLKDELYATFTSPKNPDEVVLNFSTAFERGEAQTPEAKVLREVLSEGKGTRIIGVIGEGGVGKSCIVRGVASDEEVKNRFRGGVYFISLGMDSSVDTFRSELLRILRISGGRKVAERLRDEKDLEVILEEVGRLVGRGRSLVILDDVWERGGLTEKTIGDVSGMLSEADGGVVMFTTRSTPVARKSHARVYVKRREAESEISRRILLSYSQFKEEEIEREGVGWVMEKLLILGRGLPVCLAVMGRGVRTQEIQLRGRRGRAWVVYWKMIESNRAALIWDDVENYKGLGKSLSVALDVLEKNETMQKDVDGERRYTWTEMYGSLSVMQKQRDIRICVLRRLWKVREDGKIVRIVGGFVSVGLGEIVSDEEGGIEGLRLHDLLHDFAVSCARDKGETCVWHQRLLDEYMRSSGEHRAREWWQVSDDGYIYGNVCRHLVESGGVEELVDLLLKVEWAWLRHATSGLRRWRRDFTECLKAVDSSVWNGEEKERMKRGLRLVRDAVVACWMHVRDNPRELGFQVFGRLGDAEESVVGRFLESVGKWHPKPYVRPLRRCLPPAGSVEKGTFLCSGWVRDIVLQEEASIAVAGVGKEVVVIDLEEMQVTERCFAHAYVVAVWVSDDAERALSLSRDGSVREWNVRTGEEVGVVRLRCGEDHDDESGEEDEVERAAFSGDGRTLVTGSTKENLPFKLEVWEVGSGERKGDVLGAFYGRLSCVGISANGNRVAGGSGGDVRVWNVSSGVQERPTMTGHEFLVKCVAFSPDGRHIVSGSNDATIRLWDAETKTQIGGPIWQPGGYVECVTFSADGERVVSGLGNGRVCVWECASGAQVGPDLRHEFGVNCVAASANGQFIVSGCEDGTIRIWDVEAAADVREEPRGHEGDVICVSGSADGRFYASGSFDKTVRIWDPRTGVQVGAALHGHTDYVSCVAFSPDSRRVVSGSWDETLIVWDVASGSQVGEALRGHSLAVCCVAYIPNGRFIISGSWDLTVRMWRADNRAAVVASVGEAIGNGAVLRREGMPRMARSLWELMKCVVGADEDACGDKCFFLRGSGVMSLAVTPDGRRIVCGLYDGTVSLWDIYSGEQVGAPQKCHESPVKQLDITAENEVISRDFRYREVRWKFENERGLVRVSECGGGEETLGAEVEGSDAIRQCSRVVCRGDRIQLACGDVTLATLRSRVHMNAWHYDARRNLLCVGTKDGEMLFFKVEREE